MLVNASKELRTLHFNKLIYFEVQKGYLNV